MWMCLKCGNCCRYGIITVSKVEYRELIHEYPEFKPIIRQIDATEYLFYGKDCPFFSDATNLCSISQKQKPMVCQNFPMIVSFADPGSFELIKSKLCKNKVPLSAPAVQKAKIVYRKYQQKMDASLKQYFGNLQEMKQHFLRSMNLRSNAIMEISGSYPELCNEEDLDLAKAALDNFHLFADLPEVNLEKVSTTLANIHNDYITFIESSSIDIANGRLDEKIHQLDRVMGIAEEIMATGQGWDRFEAYCTEEKLSTRKKHILEDIFKNGTLEQFRADIAHTKHRLVSFAQRFT